MLCEERLDEKGEPYTPNHNACKYFIPLQGVVPPPVTGMRLLVQSLTAEQVSALKFVIEQSEVFVGQKDSKGAALSMGDFVSFKLDSVAYTGIVEGADPKTTSVNIFCPAFPDASVMLDKRTITKLSPEESRSASLGDLTAFEEGTVGWHMECISDEIARLRSIPMNETTPEQYKELLEYTRRWNELDARLRYGTAARSLSRGYHDII